MRRASPHVGLFTGATPPLSRHLPVPHLKPHRIPVSIPEELVPLVHERMKEEHYHSVSAFFVGLLLEDLLSGLPHEIAPQIMSDPHDVLDAVVVEIVREFPKRKRGKKLSGHASDKAD